MSEVLSHAEEERLDRFFLSGNWMPEDLVRVVESIVTAHEMPAELRGVEQMTGNVTEAEAALVDQALADHVYGHRISNNISSMGCDAGCRVRAVAFAMNRVLKARRLGESV